MPNTREKLIKMLSDAHSISAEAACFEDATYAKQLRMEANHLIANGVTIPVRCKDCQQYDYIVYDYGLCRKSKLLMKNDDFCSYGERRNDV